MELLLALMSGGTLGILHAFDVDHIVAVSTLTGRTHNIWRAARMGMVWGLGHTSVIILVGIVVLAFGVSLPSYIQDWSEVFVGLLLVGLGVWSIRGFLKEREIHIHRHTHDGSEHVHFHSHHDDRSHTHDHAHSLFALGMAHGFAGSGAVIVMVPLALSGSVASGVAYLTVFGLGSTIAMAAFSLLLSATIRQSSSIRLVSGIRGFAGVASLIVGFLWIGGRLF